MIKIKLEKKQGVLEYEETPVNTTTATTVPTATTATGATSPAPTSPTPTQAVAPVVKLSVLSSKVFFPKMKDTAYLPCAENLKAAIIAKVKPGVEM